MSQQSIVRARGPGRAEGMKTVELLTSKSCRALQRYLQDLPQEISPEQGTLGGLLYSCVHSQQEEQRILTSSCPSLAWQVRLVPAAFCSAFCPKVQVSALNMEQPQLSESFPDRGTVGGLLSRCVHSQQECQRRCGHAVLAQETELWFHRIGCCCCHHICYSLPHCSS